jgi:hypothetical protein
MRNDIRTARDLMGALELVRSTFCYIRLHALYLLSVDTATAATRAYLAIAFCQKSTQ